MFKDNLLRIYTRLLSIFHHNQLFVGPARGEQRPKNAGAGMISESLYMLWSLLRAGPGVVQVASPHTALIFETFIIPD